MRNACCFFFVVLCSLVRFFRKEVKYVLVPSEEFCTFQRSIHYMYIILQVFAVLQSFVQFLQFCVVSCSLCSFFAVQFTCSCAYLHLPGSGLGFYTKFLPNFRPNFKFSTEP